MSSSDSDDRGLQIPDDLPAVQPPSTGFFVQLFLLPAVIVFGLVTVWFLFGKITDAKGSPEEFLAKMETNSRDRWKAAHDLSMLLTPQSEYVTDASLALKVSETLEQALQDKQDTDEHSQYLEYLAGALGRFNLNTGVPALRHATRPEFPQRVRWTALFSLANLASKLEDLDDPNLVLELQDLIKDDDSQIRELAAMTMGIVDSPASEPALEAALHDVEPTVRFNAARALAEHGNAKGQNVIVEMLDRGQLEKTFTVQDKFGNSGVDVNRVQVVMYEGLKGLAELHRRSADVELSPILPVVRQLLQDPSPQIVAEAKEVLLLLESEQPIPERNAADE